VVVLVLGLLLVLVNNFKPSEEEERVLCYLSLSRRYKSRACFRAGLVVELWSTTSNPAKKRREFYVIYRYHGKTVLSFRQAWQPHFRLTLFLGHQAQLGGRKLLVSIYFFTA